MSKFHISEQHIIIRILKFQERISVRFADAVICVHHLHKELLLKRTKPRNPILVLPNLPDPHVFKEDFPAEKKEKIILYHGTIAERSNIQTAISAFKRVVGHIPNVKFFIVGGGDYIEEIEQQIKSLNLTEKVYLTKKAVPVEEIPNYIKRASIGLVPYPRTLQMEYALPVKLLEYVYYQVPVITTRLKTIEYYFPEDSLFYTDTNDVERLSYAMIFIFENMNEGLKKAKKAREFFNKYSWEIAENELFTLIDNK